MPQIDSDALLKAKPLAIVDIFEGGYRATKVLQRTGKRQSGRLRSTLCCSDLVCFGIMEGLVLVEMSSGALHYTRSFSDDFDRRHPKTERLNLSALLYALQNFAVDAALDRDECITAGIVMFTTPLENMVLATTPSRSLLVVLFTHPEFNVEVAKRLVKRFAFNYDKCDDVTMQQSNSIAMLPCRFRQIFSQAIEEIVERELISLGETIFFSENRQTTVVADILGDQESFLCFNYSPHSKTTDCKISKTDFEEECRNPVRADISLSDVPKDRVRNPPIFRVRNKVTVAPAANTLIDFQHLEKIKAKRKTRWMSRNTVMSHLKPHKFQRIFHIIGLERKVAMLGFHQTERALKIKNVVSSFEKFISLSSHLFNSASSEPQQQLHNLDQFVWKNDCVAAKKLEKGMNISLFVAWKKGPCCLYVPIVSSSMKSETESLIRVTVKTLFEILEPLLDCQAKILA
ncbi:hypothetical protein Plhal304r1_c001g0000641 [Plasmopara halstedii]